MNIVIYRGRVTGNEEEESRLYMRGLATGSGKAEPLPLTWMRYGTGFVLRDKSDG